MAKKTPTAVSTFADKSAEELLAIADEQLEQLTAAATEKAQLESDKAELESKVQELTNELQQLKNDAQQAAEIIEELSRENRALSQNKGNPHPTVTLPDGRVAQLNHAALIKQVRYSVNELALRPDLVLEIVEKGGSAATIQTT